MILWCLGWDLEIDNKHYVKTEKILIQYGLTLVIMYQHDLLIMSNVP